MATPPRKRAEHSKSLNNVSALEQAPGAQQTGQTSAAVSLPTTLVAAAVGGKEVSGSRTLPADAILEALRTSSGNATGRLAVCSSSSAPAVSTTSSGVKQGWSVTGSFPASGLGSSRKLGGAFGTPIPFLGAPSRESAGLTAAAYKQQQRGQAQKAASADSRWEIKAAEVEKSASNNTPEDAALGISAPVSVSNATTHKPHQLPASRVSIPGHEEEASRGQVADLQGGDGGGVSSNSSHATVILHSNTQHSSCSGSSRDSGPPADSVEVMMSEQVAGIELRGSQEETGTEGNAVVGGRCQVLVLKPRH